MHKSFRWLPGLLLVLPTLAALGYFVYWFIAANAAVSVSDWKGQKQTYGFDGLKWYKDLFADETFRNDARNLLIFTIVFIGASMLVGGALALLLDKGVPFERFFRSVYLFPMAISFIATGIVWRWLLNSDTGASTTGINDILGFAGLHSDWHKSSSIFAVASIAVPATWALSGYVMALLLAGLRGIPEELREAARVDGASEFRVYWHVVRPMMVPAIMSALVILVHISMKTFDLIYAIAPLDPRTETPAVYMYLTSFRGTFYARGAAIATMLFFAISLVVTPYIWWTSRKERVQ